MVTFIIRFFLIWKLHNPRFFFLKTKHWVLTQGWWYTRRAEIQQSRCLKESKCWKGSWAERTTVARAEIFSPGLRASCLQTAHRQQHVPCNHYTVVSRDERNLNIMPCFSGQEKQKCWNKILRTGTSLEVRWFRHCTSRAGGEGSTPGWWTKRLRAARCGQKGKRTPRNWHKGRWEGCCFEQ